ncbi:MAG: hypothetical protein WD939_08800 [Dehalococcoidia bacterium]
MPSQRAVLIFAGLSLVVGAALARGALAAMSDGQTVTNNTFSSSDCTDTGDTGLLNPDGQAADTGGDGDGFEVSATSAFADGGGYAENHDGTDDRHQYYDYYVSIPADCSTIEGIEVRLDWWLDDTAGGNSMSVELSWDGGTSWTASKTDSTETTTEHSGTLGGSSDTWGRSWTATQLNNANFRVRVTSISDDGTRDFFLDWAPVRVYYAP